MASDPTRDGSNYVCNQCEHVMSRHTDGVACWDSHEYPPKLCLICQECDCWIEVNFKLGKFFHYDPVAGDAYREDLHERVKNIKGGWDSLWKEDEEE